MLTEKNADKLAIARLILRVQGVGMASAAPQLGGGRWQTGGLCSAGCWAWPVRDTAGSCRSSTARRGAGADPAEPLTGGTGWATPHAAAGPDAVCLAGDGGWARPGATIGSLVGPGSSYPRRPLSGAWLPT